MAFPRVLLLLLLSWSFCEAEVPADFLKGVEYVREDDVPGWPSPPTTDHMKQPVFKAIGESIAAKKVMHCSCGDFDLERVNQYKEGPYKDKWRVELPVETCTSGPVSVGPFDNKFVAFRDSKQIANDVETCFNRVASPPSEDKEKTVPKADYMALQVELELLQKRVGELDHDLARCKIDHELFLQNEDSGDLQAKIYEFLRHAGANDDFLTEGIR